MTSDIPLAFDSLLARAQTDTGAKPRDRISLRDHVVEVEIGAFQVERGTTQRVSFDVVVEVIPTRAHIDDDVDKVLSYDTITQAIAAELAAERLNLLETLAERIAQRILRKPQAERVYIRIQKLDRGPGALGVEIVRDKPGADMLPGAISAADLHPLVVFLSNDALTSVNLPTWIEAAMAHDKPVVLCVGPGPEPRPRSADGLAQRHIDLLAIDQNAWVLAGRDRRCLVVNTLTELEWSMRNGRVSVWAPSRMALDAPEGVAAEAEALLGWLARRVKAVGIISVGARAPDIPAIPAWRIEPEDKSLFPAV